MKKLLLFLAIILPIMAFAANLEIKVNLAAGKSKIDLADYEHQGWGVISAPGRLQLPVKMVNVLLPHGAEVQSWNVKLATDIPCPGIEPLMNSAFSDGEHALSSNPGQNLPERFRYLGQKKWGELNYATFEIIPAVWSGNSWQASPSCTISIDYRGGDREQKALPSSLKNRDFFINHRDLDKWYQASKDRDTRVLVITNQNLYDALAPWVAFRQSQGCIVDYVSISDAISQGSGTDNATRLRSYLQAAYQTAPFEYLLLVGDYDTVPVIYTTPEPDGSETVPTDFFYGDLSSNWDSDNDGKIGEYSTGFQNQDWEIDFTPEAYVGRISTNSATQVAAIANRIVAFEQNTSAWKNNNLLPAAFLNYQGEPEAPMMATDGATFMEYERNTTLHNMANTTMYEQEGVVPSYPSDYPLDYTAFRARLNSQSWGLINWSAHGSSTSSSRKVWMNDDNDNNFPDSWEMQWMGLVDKPSFDNLTSTDGTVIFAASCYNGMIDANNPSLAEYALIKKAVGVMGATRTGWYKIGWRNPGWGGLSSLNHHFLENYRESGMSLGASAAYANLLHTQYYLFGDPIDTGGIIYPELQNIYTYMLFGDPMVGWTPNHAAPAGEILFWEPDSTNCLPVVNAIRNVTGMNVIYTDKLIPDYDYLDNFEAVFVSLRSTDLDSLSYEYNYLVNYLNGGGKVYLESSSIWASINGELLDLLGTNTVYSGITHINSIRHTGTNDVWQYGAPQEYAAMLEPTTPSAQEIFTNNTGEAWEPKLGIWNSNGNYRSLSTSFYLYHILNDTHTLEDMIAVICDTLDIAHHEPVSNNDAHVPSAVLKLQAYPNPAARHASIEYTTKQGSELKLEVYNLKGQKVRTLYQGFQGGGEHKLEWDMKDDHGKTCASGLYFYRLQLPEATSVIKQIIVK